MVNTQTPEHVVVIGAGMVGLSTAWYLQERGVKVTIVDRKGVAAGSSWGNAGWLTPALTLPLSEPSVLTYGLKTMFDPASPLYIPLSAKPSLIRFLLGFARHCTPGKWREAMAVFSEIGATGLDAFDEISEGSSITKIARNDSSAHAGGAGSDAGSVALSAGMHEKTKPAEPFLTGFKNLKDRDALLHEFEGIRASGGKVEFDLMSAEEIRAMEPTLGDGVKAGVQIHHQRFINPPKFMDSLADSVLARGAEIVTDFDVVDIREHANGVEVVDSQGRSQNADSVVIASGAWLGQLARKFGVKRVVQAGRGYSFTVVPEVMPTHPIYFPAQRVACTPLGDSFRVAGHHGVPRRRPPAGTQAHRGDRCGRLPAVQGHQLGGPPGGMGRIAPLHHRRPAADRRHPFLPRARCRRARHVGRGAGPADRQDACRIDHRGIGPGRDAALQPVALDRRPAQRRRGAWPRIRNNGSAATPLGL